jgi:hypothetical protein
MTGVLAWLQSKLGALFGILIYNVLLRVWTALRDLVIVTWEKYLRGKRQKKATEKLEENVQKEKPRDEETRKDEADHLNA